MYGGEALDRVREGALMKRESWEPGTYVYLVPGSTFKVQRAPLLGVLPEGTTVSYRSHIDKRFEDGTFGVWAPSNDDILADDWYEYVPMKTYEAP